MKELKNQLIATVGIIITAAGGLFIANMEAIFNNSYNKNNQTGYCKTTCQKNRDRKKKSRRFRLVN